MNGLPLTDYEGEIRELTTEDFKHMRPANEILPKELLAVLPKRVRPSESNPKKSTTILRSGDTQIWRHLTQKSGLNNLPIYETQLQAKFVRSSIKKLSKQFTIPQIFLFQIKQIWAWFKNDLIQVTNDAGVPFIVNIKIDNYFLKSKRKKIS